MISVCMRPSGEGVDGKFYIETVTQRFSQISGQIQESLRHHHPERGRQRLGHEDMTFGHPSLRSLDEVSPGERGPGPLGFVYK
ncbi:hypothetical protein PoB_003070100 [Plakobranchus ocellatus]|uniref:Uncharacterized protein n=1 Tax=Plakobranchus ocellatus TaxID=259542 RepID=A0AAV3ZYZ2_9GAST|nr:hypothetical protein PoB_003070100 [Plakobranchus ocellatus]